MTAPSATAILELVGEGGTPVLTRVRQRRERETGSRPRARPVPERVPDDAATVTTGVPAAARVVTALQRTAGNAAATAWVDHATRAAPAAQSAPSAPSAAAEREDGGRSSVLDVIARPGQPLPGSVRADMESRLAADLSDVRIHTDGRAAESAREVAARAYTVGSHIAFGAGVFDPVSATGRRILAHELTHVLQQRAGPVEATPAPGGIAVSDPGDRFERAAELNAERVLRIPLDESAERAG